MGQWFLGVLATAEASIVAAGIAVAVLVRFGFHKLPSGAPNVQRIGVVFSTMLAGYTLGVLVICQFFAHVSLSYVIGHHFKDDRLGWLMVTLFLDLTLRLWNEFRKPGA